MAQQHEVTPREQLANKLAALPDVPLSVNDIAQAQAVKSEAAAELRKVCRACQHFRTVRPGAAGCGAVRNGGLFAAVPADGSGGCWHNYKPRTAAPEGE